MLDFLEFTIWADNGLNELRATKSGDEACAIMAKPSHKARPAVAGQFERIVMRLLVIPISSKSLNTQLSEAQFSISRLERNKITANKTIHASPVTSGNKTVVSDRCSRDINTKPFLTTNRL